MNESTDQIISPSNNGEVNITLKFMQRDINTLSGLIKDIGTKIDAMPNAFTSIKEFTEFKADSEKDRANLRQEIKDIKIEQSNTRTYIDTQKGEKNIIILISSTIGSLVGGIIGLIANHFIH